MRSSWNTCLLLIFSAIVLPGFGQKQANNWYFGYNAGITFSNGAPQALTNGQLNSGEGCASVSSSSSGQLLFYTDGVKVWNKNHNLMVNGTGLKGHYSGTQSAMILPFPLDTNKYYIFTVDAIENNLSNGLNYSIVDMTKQSGLGEITTKNIQLLNSCAEKITAVIHRNGIDYWLIVKEWGTNAYYSYLVTSSGVSASPSISYVGATINGNNWKAIGYMKCSPNGNMLVAANVLNNNYELFDFNNQTGAISNVRTIPSKFSSAYGVEFSPSSRFLYTTSWDPGYTKIWQYDLSSGVQTTIINSAIQIGQSSSSQIGALQLGPDNKIYAARRLTGWLGVIAMPNESGTASAYTDNGVSLSTKQCDFGLPSFIQSYFFKPSIKAKHFCLGDTTKFFSIENTSSLDSIKWIFGESSSGSSNFSPDSSTFHIYSFPGNYQVVLVFFKGGYSDTAIENITIFKPKKPILGNDLYLCNQDSASLGSPGKFLRYQWSSGTNDTLSSLTIFSDGNYILDVLDSNYCKSKDTIQAQFIYLNPKLPTDTIICKGGNILLDAANSGAQYLWSTGDTSASIIIQDSGIYKVLIKKSFCSLIDSVRLNYFPQEKLNIGNDTIFCEPFSYTLQAGSNSRSYQWSTSQDDTLSQVSISNSGTYWVKATDKCSSLYDTIEIKSIGKIPPFSLGSDTVLCDTTFKLDLLIPLNGYKYNWSHTSADTNRVIISQPGEYWVTVTGVCDTISDTITLIYESLPTYSLGNDTMVCGEFSINYDIPAYYEVLWEDGSTLNKRLLNQTGKYHITINSSCGSTTDTINITLGNSSLLSHIPNTFTPNRDSINDLFPFDSKKSGELISNYLLVMYNRWGEKIFETTELQNAWNGKYEEMDCPEGVYFYIIRYKACNGKIKQLNGVLHLLR